MNRSEEEKKERSAHHALHLQDRSLLRLDGVEEVLRFDEQSVLLRTELGLLSVDGEELQLTQLDTEHHLVTVCGRIAGMFYADHPSGREGKKRGIGALLR